MIKNGDMGFLHGLMEIFIKETIQQIKEMDMAKYIGPTVIIIKEIG